MPNIKTMIEPERGCGYRKKGGLYLIGGSKSKNCCRLPFPLTVCTCCGAGIKQSRGFTWITSLIFGEAKETEVCNCPISSGNIFNKKMGLLWVGEKYYNTPSKFSNESAILGISKRISQIPNDLIIGETWICLAHPKAVLSVNADQIEYTPGIFTMFKPTRIDYVVTGNETIEELERLEKRNITLVNVIRDIDAQTELKV